VGAALWGASSVKVTGGAALWGASTVKVTVGAALWSASSVKVTFKYFTILIIPIYYILCISWIIKCLTFYNFFLFKANNCKHTTGQTVVLYRHLLAWPPNTDQSDLVTMYTDRPRYRSSWFEARSKISLAEEQAKVRDRIKKNLGLRVKRFILCAIHWYSML